MLRYAITDRLSLGDDEPTRHAALLAQAARLASQGVDYLQLREKDLPAAALASLARALLKTLRANGPTRLLLNSRADIALATHADGVHLTSAPGQLTPTQIRSLYASANLPTPIVSISCHTFAETTRAHAASADLILFGPVFGKEVHGARVSEGFGLTVLHAACQAAAPTPILALGGITRANSEPCLAAGAAGIAAIRLFAPPGAP